MERLGAITISGSSGNVKWIEWLHAKIYVSEKSAIITSLNLLATSFSFSIESGVQFHPSRMYRDMKAEVDKLGCLAAELRRLE